MKRHISKVREIDAASVAGNKTLAAALDRRGIERCKQAAQNLGVLHTPVVGRSANGKHLLLYGQCELTALREMGVSTMDAVVIDAAGEPGVRAKLSLQLMSLQSRPGALCEGLLLQEAVSAGVPRTEIQSILGKSASWVSNRLSLVTRLDKGVYELVQNGLLEARSAEEISRLEAGIQFRFAQSVLRAGLAKSAVETLVAACNDESCPDGIKEQILTDPRAAMLRMSDKRRAVTAERRGRQKADAPHESLENCVEVTIERTDRLRHMLCGVSAGDAFVCMSALKTLEAVLLALLANIQGFTRVKAEGVLP